MIEPAREPVQEQQSSEAQGQEQAQEGHQGQADVVCQDRCTVYYWRFRELYELVQNHPQLALVIERSISEDLNRKMASTWEYDLEHRYKDLLHDAIARGEINDSVRSSLDKFRAVYNISPAVHERILQEVGWTVEDYAQGRRIVAKSPEYVLLCLISSSNLN